MVLIKSISGIRGTLENIPGKSLSDIDVIQFDCGLDNELIEINKYRFFRSIIYFLIFIVLFVLILSLVF